jgi:hypothetical protein
MSPHPYLKTLLCFEKQVPNFDGDPCVVPTCQKLNSKWSASSSRQVRAIFFFVPEIGGGATDVHSRAFLDEVKDRLYSRGVKQLGQLHRLSAWSAN